MIGYQYDADGNRVGKGTVTTIATCDITANGYTPITDYVLDQSGGQMTEMAIAGTQSTWVHSNVSANGTLIATYDTTGYGLHFYLKDALGSRRVQTDAAGVPEQTCQSLPFGDQLFCTGSLTSPTEHHFTGKERDAESGLDNFGARYYGSNMGRFMSPDPSGLLAQRPADPQSWNLYAYARNNPMIFIDPNGLDCIYANDAGNGVESIDHNSNSGECGGAGGTWVPGYVNEKWTNFNVNTQMFQVGSVSGTGMDFKVNYALFGAGAKTDENGNCNSGCGGYGFGSGNGNALGSMLVGNSIAGGLDGMIQFMVGRVDPLHGLFGASDPALGMQIVSGPLAFWTDHWAGPAGMGVPSGQGDWAAMAHDYNYDTNGKISISTYLNPFVSSATAKAIIQSNNQLILNAGGLQGIKMGAWFGLVNAMQAISHVF
jgi:RHS repeat-associated protein